MSDFFASLMAEPLGKPLTLALIIIAIQNANIFKLNVTEKDNYIVARILALLSLFINEPMLEIVVLTLMAVLVVKTLVKEIDNTLSSRISDMISILTIAGYLVYETYGINEPSKNATALYKFIYHSGIEGKIIMLICFYALGYDTKTTGVSATISESNMLCPASSDNCIDFDVPKNVPKSDKELFNVMFDQICEEIVADLPETYEMPEEAVEWIREMMDYTVAGGKMNRGLACMSCLATVADSNGKKLTDRERCKSAALGWCIEFLQAFFLVADDIMDASVTRRGKPCWYKNDNVKLIAINDSFILESCVYKILKRYCGRDPCYPQLVDLFIEVTRQTELGQLMDLTSQPLDGRIDLSRFTMDRMAKIMKYKTAFYSFYLPVALSMIVGGITDRALFDKAREILCIMGEYFQIQDDYLDCYGTPEQIGKIGTDIQDNKCSWMVITALSKCNATQKRTLEKNYGRHDDKCIDTVKKLYAKLDLTTDYTTYEEASYSKIQSILDSTNELPREVFEFLLRKIYKRSK
jgi:farnesyl diphosphate synthase